MIASVDLRRNGSAYGNRPAGLNNAQLLRTHEQVGRISG